MWFHIILLLLFQYRLNMNKVDSSPVEQLCNNFKRETAQT